MVLESKYRCQYHEIRTFKRGEGGVPSFVITSEVSAKCLNGIKVIHDEGNCERKYNAIDYS